MNTERPDFDRVLRSWFEDGPTQMSDRVVDGIASRIAAQPQRRTWRLRGRPFMNTYAKLGLAAAAAIAVVAVAGYLILPRPGPGPAAASATPIASLPFKPTIDLSAGVPHRWTPEEVEAIVLEGIARDERRAQQRLAEPRILLVRLMPVGASYSDGHASMTADTVSWLVVFQGTVVSCGSTCDAFTGGAVLIDDPLGPEGGSSGMNSGHVGRCVGLGETCVVVPDPTP